MGFRWRCKICGGSGHYGQDRADTCVVCHGRGTLVLNGSKSEFEDCAECGGNGHYPGLVRETCQICRGHGITAKTRH